MLSFKEFFLFEAGDVPYSFKEMPKSSHNEFGEAEHPHTSTYNFKDDIGTRYFTNVEHFDDHHAQVVFGSHDVDKESFISPYELRKDKGSKATRIMSTIHHIIKHHVANHPELKDVLFTSDTIEPSRVKLYTKYAERLGGTTHDSEDDIYSKAHVIPADSYRKEI